MSGVAATAAADTLYDELVVCRSLPDDARLICYDAAVDRSRQGATGRPPAPSQAAPAATATAASAAVVDSPAPSTTVDSPAPAAADGGSISQEDLFGKNQAEVQQTVEEATGSERIESLDGTVTRLQKSGYDKVVITLDNGQVWKQVDSSSLRLRVGDTIEIERASMGSYMLQKKGSKRTMRVSRQQ
jgi:hypothetical protein